MYTLGGRETYVTGNMSGGSDGSAHISTVHVSMLYHANSLSFASKEDSFCARVLVSFRNKSLCLDSLDTSAFNLAMSVIKAIANFIDSAQT